jgi:folylpolyglutamate synthase/dihydropteroate synthase
VDGLASVEWRGRLETLGREPMVVVDGAHNPYSMERLVEAVRAYLPFERLLLVFGAGVTHNPQDLLRVILPAADACYVTQAHHAKATPGLEMQGMVRDLGRDAEALPTVHEALRRAVSAAGERDLVLVTGSLFVVAEAREAWAEMQGLPPLPSDPPDVY